MKASNGKNVDVLMELSNHEMVVNALKAVMEVNLGNGSLTPEVYAEKLKSEVQYSSKLAVYLKKENRVRLEKVSTPKLDPLNLLNLIPRSLSTSRYA
jgi:hypothetical protein